ncbi:bifunctional nuclease family protein [Collinsella sp. zg1085]|uniref:bifunctional nuclease family protein n=1 Tax=Collinsella sp. zg1085 TaxID=2844380 RepID=UPI001C0DB426|nr:bifunctional nuclease family protein [Collinsella sp. zg1085]QWT17609.1 bifunctional nuclease family protein [Collinsella sp. zg1085]
MIRVDIETIVMAAGPMPSVIVLRERATTGSGDTPQRALSIPTGPYEATVISRGIEHKKSERPITHDLMVQVLSSIGARLERVEITNLKSPVFYASLVMTVPESFDISDVKAIGAVSHSSANRSQEISIDARPSDAIALAVRMSAPIYVEDDVMNRAGNIGTQNDSISEQDLERFDAFVQSVSPDDF